MSNVTLNGNLLGGGSITLDKCISFSFSKDRYTTKQEFNGKFLTTYFPGQLRSVTVSINNHTVLSGYVESQKLTLDASGYVLNIKAKAYTSMLEYNHVQPGLYTDVSFESAFSQFASGLEGITCKGGSDKVNYINCPDWTTIFNVLTHTSIRAYDTFPYVTMANELRCSLPGTISNYHLISSEILDFNEDWDTSSLISKIYMKDVNGNPKAYWAACLYTQSLGIVREKYITLMYDWLYDPEGGLVYKLNMARRRAHTKSVTYNGYKGEDIYSQISFPSGYFPNTDSFQIHAIKISGDDKKIQTTVSFFDDYYSNMQR